jgi:hypothetical protein
MDKQEFNNLLKQATEQTEGYSEVKYAWRTTRTYLLILSALRMYSVQYDYVCMYVCTYAQCTCVCMYV